MNEALGVALIVNVFLPEGGKVLTIQAEGTLASGHDDVALVQFELDDAGNRSLRGIDEGFQCFTQWGEPQSIVDQFRVLERDQVFELHGLVIDDQHFQFLMSGHQDRSTRGLIYAV